jgi:hypothetical protein
VYKTAIVCSALLAAAAAQAQNNDLAAIAEWSDALSWTSALREPMRRMTNPVVTAYGIASLGAIVCPADQSLGADLFEEAVADLNAIPDSVFHDSLKVLPVATFSGLWKVVVGPGMKCDPALSQPNDGARAKREFERREAASFLEQAKLADNYDRAAQLAQAALETADPNSLDVGSFTSFLIHFRVPAPDLADDLFQRAIAFTMESQIPSVDALAELGNYLFEAPQYVGKSEPMLDRVTSTVNGAAFSNLQGLRDEANPDLVTAYIGAVSDLLSGNSVAANVDPVSAYATAYQLLSKARSLTLDSADSLEKVVSQLEAQNSGVAAAVQAKLESSAAPSPSKFGRLMAQIRAAMSAGRFADARDILTEVDGVTVRSLIGSSIDFYEAAYSMRAKDADRTMALAGRLPPGAKRALVYAGVVATSGNRLTAIFALHLGLKDADLLSYEQRMALLPALATAASGVDRDETQAVLSSIVSSQNDANTSPRKSRFDPRSSLAFDGPRILCGPGGFQESIQGAQGRVTFPLQVTGAAAFSLQDFIAQAKNVDFMRLEATVEGLHNELHLTRAYLALALLRLKTAKALVEKSRK